MDYLKTLTASLLTSILAMSAAGVAAAPLEIAGSTTVQKTIVDPVTAKARDAGLELKMLGVGTGKGLQMLFEGKVTVAAVSDDLTDAVAAARKLGVTTVPANLKLHTVLIDKMVPIVNPDNTVQSFTKDQLKNIFSGKTQNWKEVGGVDATIVVVMAAAGSGTRGVVDKQVLGGVPLSGLAKELRTSSAEIAEVARDKNAIGYVGAGTAESAKGKVREVKAPDVSRPLGFVTIGDPNPEVKKLLDFLQTAEAKKLFIE